jgi:hypothetical protein
MLNSEPKRLNHVLDSVRSVGKELGDILCDFQVGRMTGLLFLRCVRENVASLTFLEESSLCCIIGFTQIRVLMFALKK